MNRTIIIGFILFLTQTSLHASEVNIKIRIGSKKCMQMTWWESIQTSRIATAIHANISNQPALNAKFLDLVHAKDVSAVQTMLAQQKKPDVNYVSDDTSAIFIAASNADTDMMQLLISAGADCNTPDSLGCTPLHLAVIKAGECLKIARQGADAIAMEYFNSNLMATRKENLANINMLLQHINNIDAVLPEVGTALILAASYKDIGVMKLLIQKDADYTARHPKNNQTIQEMITDPEEQQALQKIIQEHEAKNSEQKQEHKD